MYDDILGLRVCKWERENVRMGCSVNGKVDFAAAVEVCCCDV